MAICIKRLRFDFTVMGAYRIARPARQPGRLIDQQQLGGQFTDGDDGFGIARIELLTEYGNLVLVNDANNRVHDDSSRIPVSEEFALNCRGNYDLSIEVPLQGATVHCREVEDGRRVGNDDQSPDSLFTL
jgi:hypothetical protein